MWKLVTLNQFNVVANEAWLAITIDTKESLSDVVAVNWAVNNTLVRSEVVTGGNTDLEEGLRTDSRILISNVVTHSLYLRDEVQFGSVNIYDLQGSLVYNAVVADSQIDISGLSEGMYVIQWSNDAIRREEKFIKQ